MASALHPGCGCLCPVYYVETQNMRKPKAMMPASMVEVPPDFASLLSARYKGIRTPGWSADAI